MWENHVVLKTAKHTEVDKLKTHLSVQEILKDLRTERKMTLEELAAETGISKSALGNYENNDYKDISLGNLIILAKYYDVSVDYLLGLKENRAVHEYEVDMLGLDDRTIDFLKKKSLNSRLLCEMIMHPAFINFLSDLEVYVDDIAATPIRNLNIYMEQLRKKIQQQTGAPDSDHYMKTIEMSMIDMDDYFGNLLSSDIRSIAKDIRAAHKNDIETADTDTEFGREFVSAFEALQKPDKSEQQQIAFYGKLLQINFSKMDPIEFKTFMDLLQKYSGLAKNPIPQKRGRKKK